jgi:hypothetical protein
MTFDRVLLAWPVQKLNATGREGVALTAFPAGRLDK